MKGPIYKKSFNTGEDYPEQFTILEGYSLKTTIINFDIGQITFRKSTIEEYGSSEFEFGQITFLECTIKEFIVTVISVWSHVISEYLVFVSGHL